MSKIKKENIEDVFPISDISQGILFHSIRDISKAMYHEQIVFQIPITNFNEAIFNKAFSLLVQKHSNLRSNFNLMDFDDPLQIVFKNISMDIIHSNITHLSAGEQELYVKDFMKEDRLQPFELSVEKPLWRIRTFLLGPENVCLLWINHHAIIDGWSTSMVMTELYSTYQQLIVNTDYQPVHLKSCYKDFVVRQLAAKKDETLKQFWKNELKGCLRFQFPGTLNESDTLQTQSAILSEDIHQQLKKASLKNEISVRSICFAAYMYSLYMISYSNDLIAGIISNNRPVLEDADKLVGCFLNTVPVRIEVPDKITWADFVHQVNVKLLTIKKYEALSYKEINIIEGIKEHEAEPILDTFFNYTDFFTYHKVEENVAKDVSKGSATSLNIRSYELTDTFLDFNIDVTSGFINIDIRYFDSLTPTALTKELIGYFESFLKNYLNHPKELASKQVLLGESATNRILREFNSTNREFHHTKTIIELFEERAQNFPHKTAVIYRDQQITYAELDQRANAFAKFLLQKGAKKGAVTAIAMERSPEMMIAIFGVLKAGLIYIPIDPNYPAERIKYLLHDSCAELLLSSNLAINDVPKTCLSINAFRCILELIPTTEQVEKVNPEDAAYIIYTSGSTGRPKGVIVNHRSIVNRLEWMQNEYELKEWDRIIQKTPLTFDVSVWELFWWSLYGASLCLTSTGDERNPQAISEVIKKEGITVIHFVPSLLDVFCEYVSSNYETASFKHLDKVVVSGEKLLNTTHKTFYETKGQYRTKLVNLYGPTEATVDVTFHNCLSDTYTTNIPIGKPIDNTQIYVLDKKGQVQPIGVDGELYIGGIGIARGYLNKPELTSERFVQMPHLNEGCLYRTGDVVCWLENGELAFKGRQDTQVKIKGVRIELEEIEATLKREKRVRHAKVLAAKNENGNDELHAFVVNDPNLDKKSLDLFLSKELPYYAIPTSIMMIDSLPFTQNGKVDTRALLSMIQRQKNISKPTSVSIPQSETEKVILSIWQHILKKEDIGLSDNFFHVGGDSIKLLKVFNQLKKYFAQPFQVVDLFQYTTISSLSYFFASKSRAMSTEENDNASFDELVASTKNLLIEND